MTSIDMETDMWFEILDILQDMVTTMKDKIEDPARQYQLQPPDADYERKYIYRTTIAEILEKKLLQ